MDLKLKCISNSLSVVTAFNQNIILLINFGKWTFEMILWLCLNDQISISIKQKSWKLTAVLFFWFSRQYIIRQINHCFDKYLYKYLLVENTLFYPIYFIQFFNCIQLQSYITVTLFIACYEIYFIVNVLCYNTKFFLKKKLYQEITCWLCKIFNSEKFSLM